MSELLGCCVDRKYGNGCTNETCMRLPDGHTCSDCVNWLRCYAIGYSMDPKRTFCDFFPRRFRLVSFLRVQAPTDDGGTP